jgi:hypothetical protein
MTTSLDDDLRALLRRRADALPPAADPLPAATALAGRLHRRRVAASVVGTGLAVLAVVGAAALVPGAVSGRSAPTYAGPSTAGAPAATPAAGATAPSAPAATVLGWPTTPVDPAVDGPVLDAWAAGHRVAARPDARLLGALRTDDGTVVRALLVLTGTTPRAVLGALTDSGVLIVADRPVSGGNALVRGVVPGLAHPSVVVLAAPDAERVEYAADGVAYTDARKGRSAVFVRTGPTGDVADTVRVTAGGFSYEVPADVTADDPAPAGGGTRPSNVLAWPARGAEDPALEQAAIAAFPTFPKTTEFGRPDAPVRLSVLYRDRTAAGALIVAQMWRDGARSAVVLGLLQRSDGSSSSVVTSATRPGLPAVVIPLPGANGFDTLLVIPRPGTGQVLYSPSPGAAFAPPPPGSGEDVVRLSRPRGAKNGRLRLLDGDGRQTWQGTVSSLL